MADEPIILPDDIVIVTKMNHIVEVQFMEKLNRNAPIRKLNKDEYINLGTGEIKEFEHSKTRKDNLNSLRQTFKKLRYLINNNFEGKGNELHVVLTYAENMTDTVRLYKDFKRFMTRLRRYSSVPIDYISVVEPQGRGAWHMHLLLRFNGLDEIFIENRILAEMWEQGFVKVKSLKNVDNIGAYLTAYLTDIELDEENWIQVWNKKVKEVDGKRFIKGGRLHLYPPGMNLYRASRGIKFPVRKKMLYKHVKEIVGSASPHFEKTYYIESDDFKNTVYFQQYNLKRIGAERRRIGASDVGSERSDV